MADERVQRRMAAILFADVVGYSRLIRDDEVGTRARINAHFDELICPKVSEHRGRIVKTTGDGLLVEFASVVNTAQCAVEIPERLNRSPVVARRPGMIAPANGQIGCKRGRRIAARRSGRRPVGLRQ